MRGRSRIITLVVLSSALVLNAGLMPVTASASAPVNVLLEGLSSPKGLSLTPGGDLVVGQGAFGPPAPVLHYDLHGRDKGEVTELTPPENVMDVAIGVDAAWGLGSDQILYRNDGTGAEPVANIPAYQETDPDPVDQEGEPTETNPYGLAVLPNGDALVTDAANNDLLRITPEGDITTVARFDVEAVSTDHLPPEMGEFPPTIDAEAVPTAVTLAGDGFVYVSELKGFPFRPGSSRIWRVSADAEDAWCSVNDPDPACTTAWDGLTSINDIFFETLTSTLYVYEFAKDGVGVFEEGFESGEFPPAVLLEITADKITELAAGQLSQPGGVVATNRGRVFVTDGIFGNGRLLGVRR